MKQILTDLDFQKSARLLNPILESDPDLTATGQFGFDTSTNTVVYYDQSNQVQHIASIDYVRNPVNLNLSINNLTDVDTSTISPTNNDFLRFDGTNFVPNGLTPNFSYFAIFAEEGSTASQNLRQYSFGNGSTADDKGIPIPIECELFALGVTHAGTGNMSIFPVRNEITILTLSNQTVNGQGLTILNPVITIASGDTINFETASVTGDCNGIRVVAWFRYPNQILVGPQGQHGEAGRGDFIWKNEFQPNTNYTIDDTVSYLGSSYVCNAATNGTELPTDTNFWSIIAEKGERGIPGIGSAIEIQNDNVTVESQTSILNFSDEFTVLNDIISGVSISLVNNIFSIVNTFGGQNINSVLPVPINFDNVIVSGDAFNYSSATPSRINILQTGIYKINYNLSYTGGDDRTNVTCFIRIDGVTEVVRTNASAYTRDTIDSVGSCTLSPTLVRLSSGSYIELVSFRNGSNTASITNAGEISLTIEFAPIT